MRPPPPPRTPTFKNDASCLNLHIISKNTQGFFLSFYRPKIFFISKKYIVYQMNKPVSLSLSSSQTTVRSPDISLQTGDDTTYWPWFESTLDIMIYIFRDNQFRSHQCHFVYHFEPSEERRRYKLSLTFFAWQYTIHNEIAKWTCSMQTYVQASTHDFPRTTLEETCFRDKTHLFYSDELIIN